MSTFHLTNLSEYITLLTSTTNHGVYMTYDERLAKATADFLFLKDRFIGNYKTNLTSLAKQYDVDEVDLAKAVTQ
jgi:hypothetical protein